MTGPRPTVLLVDDEPLILEMYELMLAPGCRVRTADGGEAALEAVDESTDVVLLDRRMPDRSGREVLATIRDRGLPCRVAMVTAVEPDVDIVDMGFDDYLVKPVTRTELLGTVDRLYRLVEYDRDVRRYYRLSAKMAALRSNEALDTLEGDPVYWRLREEISDLRERLRRELDRLGPEGAQVLYRDIGRRERPDLGRADGGAVSPGLPNGRNRAREG